MFASPPITVNCCPCCPFTLYLSPLSQSLPLSWCTPNLTGSLRKWLRRTPSHFQHQIYLFSLYSSLYKGTNCPIKSTLTCTGLHSFLPFQRVQFLRHVCSLLLLLYFHLFITILFLSTGISVSIQLFSTTLFPFLNPLSNLSSPLVTVLFFCSSPQQTFFI